MFKMETMMSGAHPPLPSPTSIRVLRFEVLSDSDDILGHFTTIDLDDSNHPKYEALSYAWGESKLVTWITFEDLEMTIDINQNLREGLKRLHRDGQTTLIWIDAICIDQRNVEERNQQVRLMGRVYAEATQVKIWLGPGDDQVMLAAFDLLKGCANLLSDESDGKETFEKMCDIPLSNLPEEMAVSMAKLRPDRKVTDALVTSVFRRSWFERRWVIQEVWLGRQHLVLASTDAVIGYDVLCRGAFWYQRVDIDSFDTLYVVEVFCLRPFEERRLRKKIPLQSFSRFESFKASEPRDYVYALLAITDVPLGVQKYFSVDYNKSVGEVYTDATRGVIMSTRDLSVMGCSRGNPNKCASWSRDWSRVESIWFSYTNHAYTFLDGSKARVGNHTRPDEISLRGRCFGKIEQTCEDVSMGSVNRSDTEERIIGWYIWCRERLIGTNFTYRELGRLDATFGNVVTAGLLSLSAQELGKYNMMNFIREGFYSFLLIWAKKKIRDATCSHEHHVLASSLLDKDSGILRLGVEAGLDEEAIQEDHFDYYRITAVATARSTFFKTDDGLIGMARGNIEAGDRICALFGGSMPFVLRQDDTDKYWRVVGTAFIDPNRFNEQDYWDQGIEQDFSLI
jgi:hypothetical protein